MSKRSNISIVLEALELGIPIEFEDYGDIEKIYFDEEHGLYIKGYQYSSNDNRTFKELIESGDIKDYEVMISINMTFNDFYKLCTKLSESYINTLIMNITLNKEN